MFLVSIEGVLSVPHDVGGTGPLHVAGTAHPATWSQGIWNAQRTACGPVRSRMPDRPLVLRADRYMLKGDNPCCWKSMFGQGCQDGFICCLKEGSAAGPRKVAVVVAALVVAAQFEQEEEAEEEGEEVPAAGSGAVCSGSLGPT